MKHLDAAMKKAITNKVANNFNRNPFAAKLAAGEARRSESNAHKEHMATIPKGLRRDAKTAALKRAK